VQRNARTETGCSTVWVGKRASFVHLPLCEAERGERPLRGAVRTGAASSRCLASAPQAQLRQSKAAWPVGGFISARGVPGPRRVLAVLGTVSQSCPNLTAEGTGQPVKFL